MHGRKSFLERLQMTSEELTAKNVVDKIDIFEAVLFRTVEGKTFTWWDSEINNTNDNEYKLKCLINKLILYKRLSSGGRISILDKIALTLRKLNRYSESIKYYKEVVRLEVKLNKDIYRGLSGMLHVYFDMGRYDKALLMHKALIRTAKDKIFIGNQYYTDGAKAYEKTGNYIEALNIYLKIFRISNPIDYNAGKKATEIIPLIDIDDNIDKIDLLSLTHYYNYNYQSEESIKYGKLALKNSKIENKLKALILLFKCYERAELETKYRNKNMNEIKDILKQIKEINNDTYEWIIEEHPWLE